MRLIRKKWFAIVLVVALLLTFEAIAPQKGLITRAIVVGCGLDFHGESIELTAQIVAPTKDLQGGNKFAEFSATGNDIAGAIAQLDAHIGVKTSFANALLIVIGKGALYDDYAPQLDYFMRSDLVPDTITLVASSLSAKETLSQKVTLDGAATFHILNIINRENVRLGQNPTSLKNFVSQTSLLGGCVYLPYLTIGEQSRATSTTDHNIISTTSKAKTQQHYNQETFEIDRQYSVTSTAETQPSDSAPTFVIDRAILATSRDQLLLEKEQSVAFCLVNQKTSGGVLTYTDGDGKSKDLRLASSSCKLEYDKKTDMIIAKVTLIADKNYYASSTNGLPQSVEKAVIDKYSAQIFACFETCKAKNIDGFYLGEKIFTVKGERWKANLTDNWLNQINFSVQINLKQK
ncbi:MAG: Ger(x)C family spore germination C-terminal domain-containing protein [Clostridia bacterium]